MGSEVVRRFNAKTPSREDAKENSGIKTFASLRLCDFALKNLEGLHYGVVK
jgi:hypothetical protein